MTNAELAALTRPELIQLIHQQETTIARLQARITELEAQLETAQRTAKRQAAPFSKGAPKAHPKTPGQKPGPPAAHRPRPTHIDGVEEAALPLTCPACGGPVTEDKVEVQYQVDVPPVPPITTQFNVHSGHCQHCGRRVQGRHPQQTSDALGAAGVQLGPRVLSLTAQAQHDLGVPYAKISRWFESAFALQACRSAFARADQRVAERHLALYARLVLALRHSAAVSADETGWKVAGDNAWLWVFTPESVTVYAIDPHRSHEVAAQVLGEDFAGVLQCDCFLAYDALADRQQKCLQHLTRRCDEIAESKSERAVQFSHQVATLLRGAIHLRHRSQDGKISPHGYEVACGRLEAAVDRLLAKNLTAGDNARLAKLLKKHRERLFVFLYESGVRPTHAAAEQEIRPAVAVRKTSACNRSWVGAKTPAVLTSVMRTCRKHGVDFIALTMERLRNRKALLPEWVTRLLPVATAHPAIGPPSS